MRYREIIEATEVKYVDDFSDPDDIEVLVNPTGNELRDLARGDDHGAVRVMRIKGDVYAFPASRSTHDWMAIKLDLPPPSNADSGHYMLRAGRLIAAVIGSFDGSFWSVSS